MKDNLHLSECIYLDSDKLQKAVEILQKHGIEPNEIGNPLYNLIETEVQFTINNVFNDKFDILPKKYIKDMIIDITEKIYNDYDDILDSMMEPIEDLVYNYKVNKPYYDDRETAKYKVIIKRVK